MPEKLYDYFAYIIDLKAKEPVIAQNYTDENCEYIEIKSNDKTLPLNLFNIHYFETDEFKDNIYDKPAIFIIFADEYLI